MNFPKFYAEFDCNIFSWKFFFKYNIHLNNKNNLNIAPQNTQPCPGIFQDELLQM